MSGNAVGWARQRYVPCLSSAAEALLGLSRRWGGRADAVAAEIERRLDACVSAPGGAREALVPLLRLRDLHRYVEAEGDLRAVKLAVLGAAVAQGGSMPCEPARRWRAARDLVANELPHILAVPREDVDEAFKREVSLAGSRLGKLLRLCALLNLEAAGEYPPPGVNLRYVKGRFPEHAWESPQGGAWQPVAPLGRWEYLAADLAERVFRAQQGYRAGTSGRQRGAGAPSSSDAARQEWTAEREAPALASAAAERVYCRLDSREPLAQLPLLPIEPERLVPDLLRHVQGRLGAEGVRQAVLVLAACAGAEPGEAALLDKAALAAACGAATRRAARERSRVLGAVLYLLGAVTIQRVGAGESSERVRTARLITVLGWEGAQRPHGAAQAYGAAQAHGAAHGHGAAEEPVPGTWERVTLLADRVLWDAAGRPLGAALRELPPAVVALSPREHPHALAAAAWLLRHFSAQPGAAVQRSGPALLHEMGLVDGPGALAGLKRDLQRLRELGAIGRWHQARGADGALHLRMEPPGMAGAAREVHPGGLRGAVRTGARLARRKRMGGGSDWAVS